MGVSRAGYGFFIVILYVFVLPAPVIYYYLRDKNTSKAATDKDDDGVEFSNPLPGSGEPESPMGSDDNLGVLGPSGVDTKDGPQVPRATLAKLHREAREARTKQGDTVAENTALKKENQRIVEAMKQLKQTAFPTLADEQGGESEDESKLQPANAFKKTWDTRDPEQISAMKALTEEGMVSEKVLDEAKKSLENHIIEQIAASTRLSQFEQQKLDLQQRVRSCRRYAVLVARHSQNCTLHPRSCRERICCNT